VTDLAVAHVRALHYLIEGGASAALNLGTGRGHTVQEVIHTVARITGRSVPQRIAPRRAGDPATLVADASRAGSLLNWRPQHSDLDSIIRTAWHWHVAHFGIPNQTSGC
jgi:UDP-glucose 4-epimerase